MFVESAFEIDIPFVARNVFFFHLGHEVYDVTIRLNKSYVLYSLERVLNLYQYQVYFLFRTYNTMCN